MTPWYQTGGRQKASEQAAGATGPLVFMRLVITGHAVASFIPCHVITKTQTPASFAAETALLNCDKLMKLQLRASPS